MMRSAQRFTIVMGMSVVTLSLIGMWAVNAVRAASVPTPKHVTVVMEENHAYSQIIGSSQAPYINSLAADGALFTQSYAVTHPSEPNYMAIFSGSTDGLTADTCPVTSSAANLGSELLAASKTFVGYAEGLPSTGSTVCTSGEYARKHAPWVNFPAIPGSDSKPFSSFPSSNFANLPTVSFVIPNLLDDMHDGTIAEGDSWLSKNLSSYVSWAKSNDSLLIVTWDEDNDASGNHIATIFVGPMVKNSKYSEKINHYNVLRTIEDMYGLPHAGSSSSATPITDVWM
jgi:hypothetical protein